MIPWLELDTPFPPVDSALTETQGVPGLVAAGADLSPKRLLDAYQNGIFPWYSEGQPILWWSTDPRMVLYTDQFKLSRSLKKTLIKFQNNPQVEFKFDAAFEVVMRHCAALREHQGTWISDQMIAAYTELHRLGYAHSSEVWIDGELVAGVYGVCIGRMFYGESMFTLVRDASKVALAQLVFFLRSQSVPMIDCQQETNHLASLGATPIPRADFVRWVRQAVLQPPILTWKICSTVD